MRIKKETILRTVITFIALINSVLIMTGKNPLPFSDEEMYGGISAIASVITVFWSWWKNNSFTYAAITADEVLKEIRREEG